MVLNLLYFLLNYSGPFIYNQRIDFIDESNLSFQSIELKEAIIDYDLQDFLYILTGRNIYLVDTTNLKILDRTPLPQQFNYIALGPNDIFLISPTEIISLNKKTLSFKGGIGIESGDYEPMVSPSLLPQKNFLYLIAHNNRKSVIRIIDLIKGRQSKIVQFPRIYDYKYLPEQEIFVTLDSTHLNFLDLKLKSIARLKLPFPAQKFFFDKNDYILINRDNIFLIYHNGKTVDFQPICLNDPTDNSGYIFWNKDFIVLIDPFTLRIKKVLKNTEDIKIVHQLTKNHYLGINKEQDLFLINSHSALIQRLTKKEISRLFLPSAPTVSYDSLFYLQFGAFTEINFAKNFCDSIRTLGLPVFIDSSLVNLYRIKLGGFLSKNLALEMADWTGLSSWIVFQKKIESDIDSSFSVNNVNFYLQKGVIIKKE